MTIKGTKAPMSFCLGITRIMSLRQGRLDGCDLGVEELTMCDADDARSGEQSVEHSHRCSW